VAKTPPDSEAWKDLPVDSTDGVKAAIISIVSTRLLEFLPILAA
jgi:hypothetical protein